jgi:hypothetical protein
LLFHVPVCLQAYTDESLTLFRPDLAGSLNNLAAVLAGLGRPEDALAAGE